MNWFRATLLAAALACPSAAVHAQQPGTGNQAPTAGPWIARPFHVLTTGPAPTCACGSGGTVASGSTDVAGQFTIGSSTTAVLTFANAYRVTPFCTVTPNTGAPTVAVINLSISISSGTTTTYTYHCIGQFE